MTAPISPTMIDVLRRWFDLRLRDLHVAIPAVVESYDAVAQTVDATPQVMMYEATEDGTEKAQPVPRCVKCPVLFPGAGGFRLTFPIQQGDTVLLLFSESSIDLWLKNGGLIDPTDKRRHHWSDGIALPGLHPNTAPWSKASTSGATIGNDNGPQIVFRSDAIELGGDDSDVPSDYVALAQKVLDNLNALRSHFQAVEAIITGSPVPEPGNGSPSAFQTALAGAIAGSGGYPSPQSVASSVLKAK